MSVSVAGDDSGQELSAINPPQYQCGEDMLTVRVSLIRQSNLQVEGAFDFYLLCVFTRCQLIHDKTFPTDGFRLSEECRGSAHVHARWLLLKFPLTGCRMTKLVKVFCVNMKFQKPQNDSNHYLPHRGEDRIYHQNTKPQVCTPLKSSTAYNFSQVGLINMKKVFSGHYSYTARKVKSHWKAIVWQLMW